MRSCAESEGTSKTEAFYMRTRRFYPPRVMSARVPNASTRRGLCHDAPDLVARGESLRVAVLADEAKQERSMSEWKMRCKIQCTLIPKTVRCVVRCGLHTHRSRWSRMERTPDLRWGAEERGFHAWRRGDADPLLSG